MHAEDKLTPTQVLGNNTSYLLLGLCVSKDRLRSKGIFREPRVIAGNIGTNSVWDLMIKYSQTLVQELNSFLKVVRKPKLFFLFLSFRRVLNVNYSFLGNSPASEF